MLSCVVTIVKWGVCLRILLKAFFMLFCICSVGGKPGAMQPCRTCHGRGIKVTIRQLGPGMVQQMQSTCPDCRGEGMSLSYTMDKNTRKSYSNGD